jgi:ribosomal protein S27E
MTPVDSDEFTFGGVHLRFASALLMPIRFACSNCQQELSVPENKAEREVKCPRCRRVVIAPTADQQPLSPLVPPGPPKGEAPPLHSQFAVEEGESELVYAPEESSAIQSPADQDLVAIPRRIVFIQGFLLGAIAIVFFILGVVVGSHSTEQNTSDLPRPCLITGSITYTNSGDNLVPDSGSVVVVLPVARRPDPKISVDGLRATDRFTAADHPSAIALRNIGGAFARTESDGEFQVRLPNRGRYLVLVVSNHAKRSETVQPRTRDLAQIGRYLLPASEILGQQRYSWQEINLRTDRTMNIEF